MFRVPRGVFVLAKEILRHLLRRPVVGVLVFGRRSDGNVVLIRRGDTGEWAMPGGTLEWGETLQQAVRRELWEEAGISECGEPVLVGVYSRPDRDPRFHAVTVLVRCEVGPSGSAHNPLEVRDVGWFSPGRVPRPLSMQTDDLFDAALGGGSGALIE